MDSMCYTAMVTPFLADAVDEKGLSRLADFQIQNGIDGLLAVGTTGESPHLDMAGTSSGRSSLCTAGQG